MSYCQFENTANALKQCSNTLFNDGYELKEVIDKLSDSELDAYDMLLNLMITMLEELGYTVEAPDNDQ